MKYYYYQGNYPLSYQNLAYLKQLHKQEAAYFLMNSNESFSKELLEKVFKNIPYVYVVNDLELGTELKLELEEVTLENLSHFPYPFREYYFNNFLLLQELVKPYINEKRFKHSISVAESAIALAKSCAYDELKAMQAAILHDVLKDKDEAYHNEWFKYFDQEKIEVPEPIKHGYSATYFLRYQCGFRDKEVLNAIYHHTDGESKTKLAQIIYIADKREPLRKIEDEILELAFKDLNKAFVLLKERVRAWEESKQDGRK